MSEAFVPLTGLICDLHISQVVFQTLVTSNNLTIYFYIFNNLRGYHTEMSSLDYVISWQLIWWNLICFFLSTEQCGSVASEFCKLYNFITRKMTFCVDFYSCNFPLIFKRRKKTRMISWNTLFMTDWNEGAVGGETSFFKTPIHLILCLKSHMQFSCISYRWNRWTWHRGPRQWSPKFATTGWSIQHCRRIAVKNHKATNLLTHVQGSQPGSSISGLWL